MSWAANRETTRIEDVAYCLLGIFGVSMPMVYGEGIRAFTRLQEEIIKERNDLSVLAWRANAETQNHRGVLASHPSEFGQSDLIRFAQGTAFNPEFQLTNKGLRILADIFPDREGMSRMDLKCQQPTASGELQRIGIYLQQHGGGTYSRVSSSTFATLLDEAVRPLNIFITKQISRLESDDLENSHKGAIFFREGFRQENVALHRNIESPFETSSIYINPRESWDPQRRMFLTHGSINFTGHITMKGREARDTRQFTVVCGKNGNRAEPWVTIFSVAASDPESWMIQRNLMDVGMLKALCSERRIRTVHVKGSKDLADVEVTASIEPSQVDGQLVYCVDLSYVFSEHVPPKYY